MPSNTGVFPEVQYGDRLLTVEPYSIQPVAALDRHGKAWQQLMLWLGSNLTIADFALGFLPVSLGLPWSWSIAAIVLGNLIGAVTLGLCAAMGPVYGVPQLIIGRFTFGRMGGYLPTALNYVSTIGWFAVNNMLGTFGLRILLPQLAFWQGAGLLVILQGLLAIYGYNLIHVYERVMSVVLGTLFLVVTFLTLRHPAALTVYHPHAAAPWAMFAIMVASVFSYIASWGSYASDYSRYLHADVSKGRVVWNVFLGAFLASTWLELVGLLVAVLAASPTSNPIAALHLVTGEFGDVAVIAMILGGTAADALNLYSNALSASAFDIRVPRWVLTVVASLVGLALSLAFSGNFEARFEDFLLLLGYWITPWFGVLFTDFYWFGRHRLAASDTRSVRPVLWQGVVSFLMGIAVSIPFMDSSLYEGPVSKMLGGADLAFYVGFIAAALAYRILGASATAGPHIRKR
ncbi:cytosine permease [Alicyclobacillus cycloheptanicus]|uniref:NCS1 family nucleobase:cation symporter-1 n=1 Tax=Alicyclobacillus cycloheptanicus TaxID=1457 RepID=A0ABT9XGB1_9BACL|nr:cytosine permease [Alicyclobacillus cycloheptanicus]MDQ0189170.1 NCS1 family nucleobase:cation symporter-1 [Alicyclobacillus cycloheptanicus]WDM00360.1 cytosine permease [Alicyclobacillus cycloheptanicus]